MGDCSHRAAGYAAAMADDEGGSPTYPGRQLLRPVRAVDHSEGPAEGRIANRYTLHAQLGIGGMGAVYLVLDHELDEIVALKMVREGIAARGGSRARFRQEVKLARRVAHPNVVRTYDLGEFETETGETRLFLTMEYVDGSSLGWQLEDGGPLAP